MTNGLWQLYLFSALELLGFFLSSTLVPFLPDPCMASYGKHCSSAETILTNYNSIWLLSLSVYFFVLTYLNRDSAEKLKRLAYFALYCTVSNLSAILMIGSSSVAGLMKPGAHVTYVIMSFALFFVLVFAVNTDSPMVAHTPLKENLGLNLKGYLVLLTIMCLVWIFYNSDFQPIDSVMNSEDKMTKLANAGWNMWSVLVLQTALVLMYSFSYGNYKDQEAIAISSIFTNMLGAVIVWAVRDVEKAGIVTYCWIQSSVLSGLALLAVIRYRMQGRQNYEPVSSSNVV